MDLKELKRELYNRYTVYSFEPWVTDLFNKRVESYYSRPAPDLFVNMANNYVRQFDSGKGDRAYAPLINDWREVLNEANGVESNVETSTQTVTPKSDAVESSKVPTVEKNTPTDTQSSTQTIRETNVNVGDENSSNVSGSRADVSGGTSNSQTSTQASVEETVDTVNENNSSETSETDGDDSTSDGDDDFDLDDDGSFDKEASNKPNLFAVVKNDDCNDSRPQKSETDTDSTVTTQISNERKSEVVSDDVVGIIKGVDVRETTRPHSNRKNLRLDSEAMKGFKADVSTGLLEAVREFLRDESIKFVANHPEDWKSFDQDIQDKLAGRYIGIGAKDMTPAEIDKIVSERSETAKERMFASGVEELGLKWTNQAILTVALLFFLNAFNRTYRPKVVTHLLDNDYLAYFYDELLKVDDYDEKLQKMVEKIETRSEGVTVQLKLLETMLSMMMVERAGVGNGLEDAATIGQQLDTSVLFNVKPQAVSMVKGRVLAKSKSIKG